MIIRAPSAEELDAIARWLAAHPGEVFTSFDIYRSEDGAIRVEPNHRSRMYPVEVT